MPFFSIFTKNHLELRLQKLWKLFCFWKQREEGRAYPYQPLTGKHLQDLSARGRGSFKELVKTVEIGKICGLWQMKVLGVCHGICLGARTSCFHCADQASNGEISSLALFLQILLTTDMFLLLLSCLSYASHTRNWEPKNDAVFFLLSFAFSVWFSSYQGVSLGFSCRLDINSRFTRKLSKFSKQKGLFIPSAL